MKILKTSEKKRKSFRNKQCKEPMAKIYSYWSSLNFVKNQKTVKRKPGSHAHKQKDWITLSSEGLSIFSLFSKANIWLCKRFPQNKPPILSWGSWLSEKNSQLDHFPWCHNILSEESDPVEKWAVCLDKATGCQYNYFKRKSSPEKMTAWVRNLFCFSWILRHVLYKWNGNSPSQVTWGLPDKCQLSSRKERCCLEWTKRSNWQVWSYWQH